MNFMVGIAICHLAGGCDPPVNISVVESQTMCMLQGEKILPQVLPQLLEKGTIVMTTGDSFKIVCTPTTLAPGDPNRHNI